MNKVTLLAAFTFIFLIAYPVAYADKDEVKQDRRESRQDNQKVRQEKRELHESMRERNEERQELAIAKMLPKNNPLD